MWFTIYNDILKKLLKKPWFLGDWLGGSFTEAHSEVKRLIFTKMGHWLLQWVNGTEYNAGFAIFLTYKIFLPFLALKLDF